MHRGIQPWDGNHGIILFWLQDKFRESNSIPHSNYQHPIPIFLKYLEVPSCGRVLIKWIISLYSHNIITVLEIDIRTDHLWSVLRPFGTFFTKWSKLCEWHYRVIFKQIQQMEFEKAMFIVLKSSQLAIMNRMKMLVGFSFVWK